MSMLASWVVYVHVASKVDLKDGSAQAVLHFETWI